MTPCARAAGTLLAVALAATGCAAQGSAEGGSGDGRLQVVTTVAPLTNIVANIAGDRAEITGVVPEGTNSHTFDPPPQIAAVMERADVVFVNGLQLEEPTFELAEENAPEDAEIVKIGDAVLPESEYLYDFSFPKEEGKPNPHLWTDPTYAALAVAYKSRFGSEPCLIDGYRTLAEQQVLRRTKRRFAAPAGTSEHGWGLAVDLGCGVQSRRTVQHAWVQANGPRFGWVNPEWAQSGGAKPEPWHWEYAPGQ